MRWCAKRIWARTDIRQNVEYTDAAAIRRRQSRIAAVVLFAIGLLAALPRFAGSNWDGGHQLHPDERAILYVAQNIELPAVPAGSRSASSPLNPLRAPDGSPVPYPYGHLPLYLNAVIQRALSLPCALAPAACVHLEPDSLVGRLLNSAGAPRFTHLAATGRALSALADTLTVIITALLAHRLFRRWSAGLLAAALAGGAVLHIQNAHFGTVDSLLALFSTAAVWLMARFARTGRPRDSLLAGACLGLAVSCKASAALLAVPLLAAHLAGPPWPRPRLAMPRVFWLTILAALLAFAATSPCALLDPLPFLNGIGAQAAMVGGGVDWPFTRQYIGTLPVWPFIEQQARWGLGLPLTLAAYAGLGWATVGWWRRRTGDEADRPMVVALVWAWAALLVIGTQAVRFPRYMLPLTPTLIALAGGLLTAPARQRAFRTLRSAAAGLVVITTAAYAAAFSAMFSDPHPWVAASTWIYRHLPPGTIVTAERWDDPLPLDMAIDGRGFLREEWVDTRLLDPFAEPDDLAKLQTLLADVADADLIILSSNRLYGVIPRLDRRYPLSAAYYRALFAGDLGFTLTASFSRYPRLAGLTLVDDPFRRAGLDNPLPGWPAPAINLGYADESFTLYDHPLVLVFSNTERLSPAELEAIVLSHSMR